MLKQSFSQASTAISAHSPSIAYAYHDVHTSSSELPQFPRKTWDQIDRQTGAHKPTQTDMHTSE